MWRRRRTLETSGIRILAWAALALAMALPPLLASADEAPGGATAADAALAQGGELFELGSFEAAVVRLREAAAGFADAGRTPERVAALVRLAEAEQALGQYAEALRTLSHARRLAEPSGDARLLAAIEGSTGNALLAVGPPEKARRHLEAALARARTAGDGGLVAAILNNLGNLHASRGSAGEAIGAYQEAARRARESGKAGLAARALANAARLSLDQGDPQSRARPFLDDAFAFAQQLPETHHRAYLLINLGRSYGRIAEAERSGESKGGDPPALQRAWQLLSSAASLADRIGDVRAGAWANGYLGQLYESQGRNDEALELTRRALFLAQEARAPESLYLWHWQSGRILRAKGQPDAALEQYRAAVSVLGEIRQELARGYATGEASYRDAVGPVYLEYVDLLLAGAGSADDDAARVRLLEAREAMEGLKAAELRDYFQDECVDSLQAKYTSIDEVLSSDAVVYPIPLRDRLELLLTFRSGMKRVTVPVGADVLTAEVRRFRQLLEKRTTRQFLPGSQKLYDWLVRPIEPELARHGITTLVFVPDGALRTIPMSALHDGERFLVEKYALATTPGLGLTDPRPLKAEGTRVLLSGLSESVSGLAALPRVADELASIQEIYGGRVLLDQEFKLLDMKKGLSEGAFGIVHIASHGEFSEDAASSYLQAYDGRLTMDRLSDYVSVARFRDQPIELLTLSACETAEGNDRAALGLAGVAIKAGARSALGTLWKVNDAAAAELVTEFYRQIHQPTLSKAEGLRHAQQKMLEDAAYSHPYYWSAFLLISNWL